MFTTENYQIRNSSFIQYYQQHYPNSTSFKSNQTSFKKGEVNNTYTGQVKEGTQKRIRKALDLFLQITKEQVIFNPVSNRNMNFRLGFITLTISQKEIYDHKKAYSNLLSPFLDWLRKTKNVDTYIWKAELQKRKQIHYHITINSFIHHTEIREKWNYLQRKNGIIKNEQNPPSTEIKKVYKIKNIEHYLAKYIAKAVSDNDKLNCKVWDCSSNLKSNKFYSFEITEDSSAMLLNNNFEDEIKNIIVTDNCIIIKLNEESKMQLLKGDILKDYNNYLSSVKNGDKFVSELSTTTSQKMINEMQINFNKIEKKVKSISS